MGKSLLILWGLNSSSDILVHLPDGHMIKPPIKVACDTQIQVMEKDQYMILAFGNAFLKDSAPDSVILEPHK